MVKTLHAECSHTYWDHSLTPALHITSGETIELKMKDASNGQLNPDSTSSDVVKLDLNNVNPVTGPVYIEEAEPGDAIKVSVLELKPSGWGWTANIPNFGLLSDEFPDAELHIWKYDADSLKPALFSNICSVPLKPFIGTIGNAPAISGKQAIIPPRRCGGNMDLHDIGAGADIILPVECEGALFSAGDTHAAQGDGEVCGTAIESPIDAILKIELIKAAAPKFPIIQTREPTRRHLDKKGFEITTGIGNDLLEGAKDAVKGMIELLTKRYKIEPVQAYMLCSVCADLRISEIVNQPNYVISCYFPRIIFE